MRLRTRFSLVLGAFSLVMMVVAVVLTRYTLVRNAMITDDERAWAALDRGREIFRDDEDLLRRTVEDWASGDDSYAFMADHNQAYRHSNLVEDTLGALRLRAIAYFDTNRQEVETFAIDSDGRGPAPFPEWIRRQAQRPDGLLDGMQGKDSMCGLLANDEELWLVAAASIRTRRGDPPSRGTLLMARHIDAAEKERLKRLIHESLVMGPAGAGWPPGGTDIRVISPQTLVARTVVADVFGGGRVLLDLAVPREAFAQISANLFDLTAWIAVCGMAMTLVAFGIMDRWVLRCVTESVSALRAGIAAAPTEGHERIPLKKTYEDEIGELVDAVNTTLAAFEASELQIRASEMRYRMLVETMPEAIAGIDRDTRLLVANRTLATLTGVSETARLVGMPLRDVLSPTFAEAVTACVPHLIEGQSMELGPLAVKIPGDEERWVMAFLTPVKAYHTVPAYTLVCLRDITTELKARREAERRRTEAMQSQRLAAMGTLIAGVAHEVNNPNSIVNINMNVLRRMLGRLFAGLKATGGAPDVGASPGKTLPLEDEMEAIVQETLAASERIAKLVASLKSFTQPADSGPGESIDVGELMNRSIGWVRHEISRKGSRLEVDPALKGLRVRGHAQQLQQVFINLLTNACAAVERPDAPIRIGATRAPDGQTITIAVSDEGKGISPEDLEYVLDPFFTTRRGEGGTGLGLSISSAIVKAHGGTLRVQSTGGVGTTVTVTLPAEKEDSHAV